MITRGRSRRDGGAAATEFVICLPLMAFILCSAVACGTLVVQHASSHAAARYAAMARCGAGQYHLYRGGSDVDLVQRKCWGGAMPRGGFRVTARDEGPPSVRSGLEGALNLVQITHQRHLLWEVAEPPLPGTHEEKFIVVGHTMCLMHVADGAASLLDRLRDFADVPETKPPEGGR